MIRCKSSFCITNPDGIKGRLFTPAEKAQGVAKIWCDNCMNLGKQLSFFANETANMIRRIYVSYEDTDLPKEVKLFLTAYTREIMDELGQEL